MSSILGMALKDRYQIQEELGRGGMAVVYRARDAVLQRDVAVKVLHAHLADRKVARQRLRREALAVAKLSQDNILKVYDFSGEDEFGPAFIVTEYVSGSTLRALLDEQHDLPCEVAAMVGVLLADALSHAHKAGIIHRDIKPENIMYRTEDGALKLMDFGIAKLFEEKELTLTGGLLGSPAHMAPEVIEGKPADARSDIFSLGTVMYLLATGDYPFWAQNPHALLRQISQGKFKDPEHLRPAVGRRLSAIIKRAMALDPEARYPDAETLARELRVFLAELGIDEPHGALGAVLRDPDVEGPRLKAKVVEALLVRAKDSQRRGKQGEVLAHLNRILGYDPENLAAQELLASLHQSNRLRYVAAAVGALLVLGGGGFWGYSVLIRPPDVLPTTLEVVPTSLDTGDPLESTPTTLYIMPFDTMPVATMPTATMPVTLPVIPPTTVAVVPKTNPVIKPEIKPTSLPVSKVAYPVTFKLRRWFMDLKVDGKYIDEVDVGGKEVMLTEGTHKVEFYRDDCQTVKYDLKISTNPSGEPIFTIDDNTTDLIAECKLLPAMVKVTIKPDTTDDVKVYDADNNNDFIQTINSRAGMLTLPMQGEPTRDAKLSFVLQNGKGSSIVKTLKQLKGGNHNNAIVVDFEHPE